MKRTTLLMSSSILVFVVSMGLSLTASAEECKPKHQIKTIVPGTLTIVSQTFPPYDIPSADGSLSGVEGDILKSFAELECLKINTMVVDASAAIQYLVTNRTDLAAASWFRTAERAKVVGISDPLYLDQLGIYSKEGYSKISELEGKRVGTIQGYNWVSDLQRTLGGNVKMYPNPVALAQDLAAGRVDIGVDSYGTGVYAQRKGGYANLKIRVGEPDERVRATVNSAQIGFLYQKGNDSLGTALNDYIAWIHKNGSMVSIFKEHGLDAKAADPGPSRLIQ
ncbi:amino acid ABC transporter substrate-binding protein (PAAT family) [Paraburkholderia sp. BL27I4N3]|uniref:substrate-binding periplasmic protein n=1 Tax=Paraburkholderia sp. BL27I4N3 TaxID=1938805 RepID=UPI000E381220|nr:transporter substrate-binding domain-containing protein [Paraburkholderia sp. BL27I4N3]REE18125.1 amino acid ABC transporter substrate-binding protein (PAAT family) [Paraburkholderia sp. BL27I4N3]